MKFKLHSELRQQICLIQSGRIALSIQQLRGLKCRRQKGWGCPVVLVPLRHPYVPGLSRALGGTTTGPGPGTLEMSGRRSQSTWSYLEVLAGVIGVPGERNP